jgi:hypothetical protein
MPFISVRLANRFLHRRRLSRQLPHDSRQPMSIIWVSSTAATWLLLPVSGPMGGGLSTNALHGPRQPKLLVVTDIDAARLARAESIYTVRSKPPAVVSILFISIHPVLKIPGQTAGNSAETEAHDDVYVYAASRKQSSSRLIKFWAMTVASTFSQGRPIRNLAAKFNFYNVHYNATHVAGNSGGNTDDLVEVSRADGSRKKSTHHQ